jgi:hypothetical protein
MRPVESKEELKPKPCTATKKCRGTMTWTPDFRLLQSKNTTFHRPAWVCDICRKHDYVK